MGIRVEEICGGEGKTGKLWLEMAKQIYCENGKDGFREIGHFSTGAPFIFGSTSRISISHTNRILAVASLPKTPETDLSRFSPRSAMGIDAELLDRSQVLKIRERFLSDRELEMIPKDDLPLHIIAWTSKEAIYKAALTPGLDFREGIRILELPELDLKINQPGTMTPKLGRASVKVVGENGSSVHELQLYSYESEGHCITIAFSPKCAKSR